MINDGLNKHQRYRWKNIADYRKKKAAYSRTPEQRAIRTEYMKFWRARNRKRHNELARESHHRNKHKHVQANRNRWLLKNYGITLAEKESMIKRQSGLCKICGKSFTSPRSTHLDHDHRSGLVRGILCHVCNTKLEWYEKNRIAIKKYLK